MKSPLAEVTSLATSFANVWPLGVDPYNWEKQVILNDRQELQTKDHEGVQWCPSEQCVCILKDQELKP